MKLEYALLLALVSAALLSGLHAVGEKLGASYSASASAMVGGDGAAVTATSGPQARPSEQ